MSGQPRRDTGPERRLRSLLHQRGLRFWVHRHVVPGATRREVDIVFPKARVAVSVLGCFWHGCPLHTRLSTGETRDWWRDKLNDNRRRDHDTRERLETAGWQVIEVWECDDFDNAVDLIEVAICATRGRAASRDSSSSILSRPARS
jgi:DNA mismatch endonuclease (patch repair protein)